MDGEGEESDLKSQLKNLIKLEIDEKYSIECSGSDTLTTLVKLEKALDFAQADEEKGCANIDPLLDVDTEEYEELVKDETKKNIKVEKEDELGDDDIVVVNVDIVQDNINHTELDGNTAVENKTVEIQ